MQAKKWLIILVGVFLLVVVALCVLAVLGVFYYMPVSEIGRSVFVDLDTPAQSQESRVVEVSEETELVMTLDAGDISVVAGESDVLQFDMVKTAWRANEEAAEAAVNELAVNFTESAGRVTVDFSIAEGVNLAGSGQARVDFTIRVPEGTSLDLTTRFGALTVQNIAGEIKLAAEFGDIEVENAGGGVEISNRNGDVRVTNLETNDGNLEVTVSFGGIRIRNVSAGDISLTTDNGDVSAETLEANGDLALKTQFGSIDLSDFEAGSLAVETSNGGIDLRDGVVSGDLAAQGGFQPVEIQDVDARSFEVNARNGNITLTGGSGPIKLQTEFGDLELKQVENAVLDLNTGNGKIRFSGSLDPDAIQSLETNFGDIELIIPGDSSFDVRLQTQFGVIRSELPVTLHGDISEKSMTGMMNAGGPVMTIQSQNGNITISESIQSEEGEQN